MTIYLPSGGTVEVQHCIGHLYRVAMNDVQYADNLGPLSPVPPVRKVWRSHVMNIESAAATAWRVAKEAGR